MAATRSVKGILVRTSPRRSQAVTCMLPVGVSRMGETFERLTLEASLTMASVSVSIHVINSLLGRANASACVLAGPHIAATQRSRPGWPADRRPSLTVGGSPTEGGPDGTCRPRRTSPSTELRAPPARVCVAPVAQPADSEPSAVVAASSAKPNASGSAAGAKSGRARIGVAY